MYEMLNIFYFQYKLNLGEMFNIFNFHLVEKAYSIAKESCRYYRKYAGINRLRSLLVR